MNQRKRKPANQEKPKNKKIIRCRKLVRPVFEHDTCSEFINGINKEKDNTCGNCKFSN